MKCEKYYMALLFERDFNIIQILSLWLVHLSIGSWSLIFNPLPDDKILGLSKLKAIAEDKLNVTQDIIVVFSRIENIVEKEENAGYQHFLLFPQCFQKASSSSASNFVIVWLWVKFIHAFS